VWPNGDLLCDGKVSVATHKDYLGTTQIRRKGHLRSRHASVCAAEGDVVEWQAQLDGAQPAASAW
jgi:hypothetical protein